MLWLYVEHEILNIIIIIIIIYKAYLDPSQCEDVNKAISCYSVR